MNDPALCTPPIIGKPTRLLVNCPLPDSWPTAGNSRTWRTQRGDPRAPYERTGTSDGCKQKQSLLYEGLDVFFGRAENWREARRLRICKY